ncbi:MAG: GMC family oxidoreductase N-terminal domain-containing protein [Burkholderiales bacterium]|nr:GMC family oxidoreductase N-terminal domain-containing protein [Burkholderiales bacterium]
MRKSADRVRQSFDYIVIGSGSAGAVLAARLTEDAGVSVLVLEAGGMDRHPLQLMPLAFLKVGESADYNWHYETEPEPGLGGRRIPIGRGRTLGGSSSINALIYSRGNARDYECWAAQGLEGWGYADVLPYFRRLESHWRGAGLYHGADGPIRVTPIEHPDMLFEPLVEAARAAGIPINEDPNGATQDGFSRMETTIGRGRRSSTARAYLYPAMKRPNLVVRTRALTTRILVENRRAVGVEYLQDGAAREARAAREVLLCAGSYNSPQILMLSGIGPPEHLRSFGIEPIHPLPGVGRNLSEHPNFISVYALRERRGFTRHLRLDRATAGVARWFLRHDGAFASNGAAANIFLRTLAGLDRPDVQLTPMPIHNGARLWLPGVTQAPLFCYSIRIGVMHPNSRGWVQLRSADPSAKPRIQLNLYAAKEDLQAMIRGVRACRALFGRSPLREMIERELTPGPEVTADAALEAVIRNSSNHRSHPVGTCRMGTDEDAVVDPQLRLRGIEGLRVVDASVMPEVTGGNTNVPSIMIGEKAADLIRGQRLPRAEVPGADQHAPGAACESRPRASRAAPATSR